MYGNTDALCLIELDLLEPESIRMLKTAEAVKTVYSNPSIPLPGIELDASPLIVQLAAFFENEINHSVVQWMRQCLGIEMPEYYCRHQAATTALLNIQAGFTVDLNQARDGQLVQPPLGNSLPAFILLSDQQEWVPFNGPQKERFLNEWNIIREQRNAAAHAGSIHPEQINVVIGSLRQLNHRQTFNTLFSLKSNLRRG